MKFLAIIQLTFRESLAKKTFITFLGISTIICLLFLVALNLNIVDGMQSSLSILGKQVQGKFNLKDIILGIESFISVALYSIGLFMALFAASGLIPSFLEKGHIDLLISKPLSRFQILTARYLGAVAIVAFNVFYLIIFSWLILSSKTGIWNTGYLMAGFMIVIIFSILYAFMTFLGVWLRSSAIPLMLTYFIIFFSPMLLQRDNIYALLSSKFYGYLLDGLYHCLPKMADLGNITRQLVQGDPISSWVPLWTSLCFGIFMLTAANILFSRQNL